MATPPAIVWNQLTALEKLADWFDDWQAVDYTRPRGELRVGSTFHLMRELNRAWCRATVADSPNRLRWLEVTDDRTAATVEFRLEPDGMGGTVLTHSQTNTGLT